MMSDSAYTQSALNIERHTPKDPKRFSTYADIENQLRFFYDSERENLKKGNSELYTLHSTLQLDVLKNFISEYISVLDPTMSVEDWFTQLKEIGKKYGFAGNNAEFKE